jgi:amino acid adenylation domain-containing protein
MTHPDAVPLSAAKSALLAERLRGHVRVDLPSLPPVRCRADESRPPLSVDQEPLWYFSRLVPTSPVYNEAVTIRKEGPFDADAFRRAFNEFVRRHEAWRTTFTLVAGEPAQVVNPTSVFELPLLDLSLLSADEAEYRASRQAAEVAKRPYDLEHGPLLRPNLVRFADDHHRLYLAMHHLIFDGVTLYRILLPELVALYDAFAAGKPSPLQEPVVQYGDYAEWEQDWVSGPAVRRRMEYWRSHLAGAPSLEFPLDHPRPAVQRFCGQVEEITVGAEVASGLRSLAKQAGVTLFQVLATAYGVVLSRYSGQQDVVFGTVADLRQRPELNSLVGYSLTPVVIRLNIGGDPTIAELLSRTRSEMIDALDNLVPFATLVREIQPHRARGSNPVFQAMIELQPPMTSPDPSWSVHLMQGEIGDAIGHAKVDLDLELDERPDGRICGLLIFDTDIVKADTARRMAGHFITVLHDIATDATKRVSAIPLLTEQERHTALIEWNATEADYPSETCVHGLVAARAKLDPHGVAVVFEGESLTYRELDRRANALAHRLSTVGARSGTVVGLHAERSLEMIVGLLAILKTGAAILPLDPSYPASRLTFMMEDSGAKILLADNQVAASPPIGSVDVVSIEPGSTPELREDSPSGAKSERDAMYIVYTSGSTGKPKAVSIRHRSVVNLLTFATRRFSVGPGDTVGAVATFAFDMSVLDFWLPLVTGARLCVIPRDVAIDARRLNRLVTEAGITFMQATPSTWQMLVDAGWTGSGDLSVVSAGEALTPLLAKSLRGRCAALWNAYGPTETTVWATLGEVEDEGPITVGRPITNARVYILDDRGEPVPIGVPGEIAIGGVGVCDGYLNRPDETGCRFVPDKFVSGGRLYRTGDLARFLSDGRIEHLGRLDQQIKHHGYRIEPAEIEATLRTHPNVAAAVVVKREDIPDRTRLVAYIVPTGPMATDSELRQLLRATLPEYMVPTAFVVLDRIPHSVNGKLDRRSLPAPSIGGCHERSGSAPPSALEAQLLRIWTATLGVEELGVEDDFFELGGDSLMAWRLVAAVGQSLGIDLPLVVLFEKEPTVRGMAAGIRAHQGTSAVGVHAGVCVPPNAPALTLFYIAPHEWALKVGRLIATLLGEDCKIEGLVAWRLGVRVDRSKTVESTAEEMLTELRSRQPRGPYFIAGYSMGGLVAYEVAGKLRAAGEDIGWLGLLDCGEPSVLRRRQERARAQSAQDLGHRLRRIAISCRHRLHRRFIRLGPYQFDMAGLMAMRLRHTVVGHDAPLNVFISDRTAAVWGCSGGWDRLHKGVLRVHSVPGDHTSIVEAPQLAIVAQVLSERMKNIPGHKLDATA